MIVADQIVAHLVGDYVIQSDWMANEKTKKSAPALVHAVTYALPFLFLTLSWKALLVICVTHFLIDRFRIARYLCYVKNFLAPRRTVDLKKDIITDWWHPWSECSGTGYHKDRQPFMSVWLLIITDNTMHLLINGLAIQYLP